MAFDITRADPTGQEVWGAMNQVNQYFSSLQQQQQAAAQMEEYKRQEKLRDLTRQRAEIDLGTRLEDEAAAAMRLKQARGAMDKIRTGDLRGGWESILAQNVTPQMGPVTFQPTANGTAIQAYDSAGKAVGVPTPMVGGEQGLQQALMLSGAIPLTQLRDQYMPRETEFYKRAMEEQKYQDQTALMRLQTEIGTKLGGSMGGLGGGLSRGGLGGSSSGGRGKSEKDPNAWDPAKAKATPAMFDNHFNLQFGIRTLDDGRIVNLKGEDLDPATANAFIAARQAAYTRFSQDPRRITNPQDAAADAINWAMGAQQDMATRQRISQKGASAREKFTRGLAAQRAQEASDAQAASNPRPLQFNPFSGTYTPY